MVKEKHGLGGKTRIPQGDENEEVSMVWMREGYSAFHVVKVQKAQGQRWG